MDMIKETGLIFKSHFLDWKKYITNYTAKNVFFFILLKSSGHLLVHF